jgi:UDP-N-acetylglucosamine acyltransferase
VKSMYKLLYRDGLTLDQACQQITALKSNHTELELVVDLMTSFLSGTSPQRGIVR